MPKPEPGKFGSFLADAVAAALEDQALFHELLTSRVGDFVTQLNQDLADDMPPDGKFYVPVKVDDRTILVLGPPTQREQNARPVGAQPAPARAESAHDGDSYTCTLRTEYGLDLQRPKSRNARKMARVDGVR